MPRALKAAFAKKKAEGKEVKVAMTFPGGTHDLWIRYWLAAGGIDPDKDVSTIVVPPPQMVANMKVGNMDAFCVGEPWNEQLVNQDIGFTALTTGELWFKHPEKILGMRADFVDANPKATQAILMAVMEAQQWCDKLENKQEMAEIVGRRQWFNVPVADIIGRIKGDINYGHGRTVKGTNLQMKFWGKSGESSYPWKSLDTLVRHRKHPLGQVRARHRHQGARRQDQPLRPLDRGRQGARRRRPSDGRLPRRREILRRQDLRSGEPAGLSQEPLDQARGSLIATVAKGCSHSSQRCGENSDEHAGSTHRECSADADQRPPKCCRCRRRRRSHSRRGCWRSCHAKSRCAWFRR